MPLACSGSRTHHSKEGVGSPSLFAARCFEWGRCSRQRATQRTQHPAEGVGSPSVVRRCCFEWRRRSRRGVPDPSLERGGGVTLGLRRCCLEWGRCSRREKLRPYRVEIRRLVSVNELVLVRGVIGRRFQLRPHRSRSHGRHSVGRRSDRAGTRDSVNISTILDHLESGPWLSPSSERGRVRMRERVRGVFDSWYGSRGRSATPVPRGSGKYG